MSIMNLLWGNLYRELYEIYRDWQEEFIEGSIMYNL